MTRLNDLQRKVGGRAATLNKAVLVAAAERARAQLLPELAAAIERARVELLAASAADGDTVRVFGWANDIRQLAECANRPSTGLLAHYLASYLTHCAGHSRPPAAEIVAPLVRAIDQSFTVQEGDPILLTIVAEGARVIRRFGIAV